MDTDADGFDDMVEIALGSDLWSAFSVPPFGDVDGDGATTVADARALAALVANGPFAFRDYNPLFDVDADGDVDNRDARSLELWASGDFPGLILPVPVEDDRIDGDLTPPSRF